MATLTSSLIVRVLDQASAPARAIARNLLGINKAAEQAGRGGFGDRLNAAIDANNRALDRVRGQMVDTIASVYALRTALGAPINAAVKFESAMADIAKVSGFDDKGLDIYGKRLRKLAVTEIPLAVNDLAALSAAAAQAGVPDADLFDFTRLTAKAAVAWEMSGAEAGEALAKIRTALGLTNDQTSAYADAVNYVSDSTAASSRDLIDFTKRVASQGEFFGFAKEQTLAFGAAMISAGAESEVAATSFRNMGRALARGASATKAQRGAWKRLGMDAVKVAKAMQKDAVGTTVKVIEKLGQLPEHMQASVMSDLFGDEARALAPLLNNTELLRKALALTADEQKYLNSVGREFEKRAATSEYKLQRFKSQLADIGLTVGASLLPALNKLLVPMGEMALKLSDWAEAHPELIRNIIAATAAVVGFRAAVVSLKWLGLIGRGGALTMLALGFNTIGRAAIGATVAARSATALQRALAAMQGVQPSRFQTITTALKGMALAVPGMGTLSTALGLVGSALTTISAPAWGAIAIGVGLVAAAGASLYKWWDRITAVVSGVARAIGDELAPVIEWASPALEPLAASARAVGDAFGWISDKVSAAAGWLAQFFEREVLTDAQKAAIEGNAYEVTRAIASAIKSGTTALYNVGVEMAQALWDGLERKFNELLAWLRQLPSRIKDAVGKIDLSNTLSSFFGGGSVPAPLPMPTTGSAAQDAQRALDIAKELASMRQAEDATWLGLTGDEAQKLEALEEQYRSATAGLPAAAQADMEAYVAALSWGGDGAGAEADRIANEMLTKLGVTVAPTIDTTSIRGALSDVQRLDQALRSVGSAVGRATPSVSVPAVPIDGARKSGGPVKANDTYLVGEDGAELFRPDRSGTIIPADETKRMLSSNPAAGDDDPKRGGRGGRRTTPAVPLVDELGRADVARSPAASATGGSDEGRNERSAVLDKMAGLLAELRSFSAAPRALQPARPAQAPAPANVTLSPVFHFAMAEGNSEEVERAVRSALREETRELIRGIHADYGVVL